MAEGLPCGGRRIGLRLKGSAGKPKPENRSCWAEACGVWDFGEEVLLELLCFRPCDSQGGQVS